MQRKTAAEIAAEKKAALELDPTLAEETAPEEEETGAFKAVYRELLADGTRKGPIAYKDFKTKKAAEKFVEETGGKLV
jgi:ribosomal protein L15